MTKLVMPFSNPYTYDGHGGMDYAQSRGTPVRAEGSGVIDWSGYYSSRGGFAKFITFDNGERRGYYHFDREQGLGRGSRVQYGQTFAYVGSLGQLSTGPHLHHEVWRNGTIVRPPAYWDHVDRNRYVGDGSSSGGTGDEMTLTPDQATQLAWLYETLTPGKTGMKGPGIMATYAIETRAAALSADAKLTGILADWQQGIGGQQSAGRLYVLLTDAADESDITVALTEAQMDALAVSIASKIEVPSGGATPAQVEQAVKAGLSTLVLTVPQS